MKKIIVRSLHFAAFLGLCASFSTTIYSQFTIKVPKLPKIVKEKSQPNPPADSDNGKPDPVSPSSSSLTGKVRGIPITGAKITFSNNPDGSGPKTSFTSSEFIYGRLDLGGKTVYDAFGLKSLGDAKFYYINYHLKILPAGEEAWEHDWHNGQNFTLMTKEDAQKTYWNFDVLPDPGKISTLMGAIENDLNYFNSPAGIYSQFYSADSARSLFPKNGTYTVDITLFGKSFDDWGKPTGETETYPTASAKFAFQFSGADGQTLVANHTKARESVEAAKNKREILREMPSWWSRGATPPEPKLTPARLVPMIKGFIGQWNLTYLKHAIYPYTGPLWVIEKNSLGIPEYRMVSPYIYIIYKDPKDDSCQFGALYMRESYAGSGTYGEPYLGGIREVQHIDCAAVK
jgi:hypothetical protein